MGRSRARTGCLIAAGTPFAVVAIILAVAAFRIQQHFGFTRTVILLAWAAFACAFAGLGLMAMGMGLWGRQREFVDESLRAQHPDQQWMWHPEWVARRISDQSRAGTFLLWAFALLWNAIASPAVLLSIPDVLREKSHLIWAALIFPLAGLVFLINALRLTLRGLRFRDSTLVLDTMPVPIGGTLRGTVEIPRPLTSVSAVMIRLTALAHRLTGSTTTSTIASYEERELDPALLRQTASGTIIPIEMPVPSDAPPTEISDTPEKVFWRLSVDAEVPGVDYSATFDVPVFKTAFSDFRPHGAPAAISAPIEPRCFVERQTPEGRELYFPRFPAPERAALSLLVTCVWIAATAFMVIIEVPIAFPIVFGIVAFPLILATLELFFETRTILLGPHHVTLRRHLLWKSEKVIAYSDIESAHAVSDVAGTGARPYYHIHIQTTAGKRIKAAKNVGSKREAEWVVSRIKPRS